MSDVEKLAGDLNSLNTALGVSGFEFKGFAKRLIQSAEASSKASKRWTTFSRLVSGTPLWAVQNKLRAYVDILASFETNSKEASKAQQDQNKKMIDSVKTYSTLSKQMTGFNKTMLDFNKKKAALSKKEAKRNKENAEMFAKNAAHNAEIMDKIPKGLNPEIWKDINKLKLKDPFEDFNYEDLRLGLDSLITYTNEYGQIWDGVGDRIADKFTIMDDSYVKAIEGTLAWNKAILETPTGAIFDEAAAIAKATEELQNKFEAQTQINESLKEEVQFHNDLKTRTGQKKQHKDMMKDFKSKDIFGREKEEKEEGGEGGEAKGYLSKKRIAFIGGVLKFQKGIVGFTKYIAPIFSMLRKYLIRATFFFIIILGIAVIIAKAWSFLQGMGVMDDIMSLGSSVAELIKGGMSMIGAFLNGDYQGAIDYAIDLAGSVLDILWDIAWIALKGLGALIASTIVVAWELFTVYVKSDELREKLFKILWRVAAAWFLLWVAQALAYWVMGIVAIYAIPVLIGVVLGVAILGLMSMIADWWKDVEFFASGGVSSGGMAIVGERGPELVNLPSGSRVHSNKDSRKMVSNAGSDTNIINVTINAHSLQDNELRRVAQKVGDMINRQVNRSTSSSTIR